MNELTIYNYKGLETNTEDEFVTIKGVSLEDILSEYSIEEIVDALVDTDKDAGVIDELAKRSVEE